MDFDIEGKKRKAALYTFLSYLFAALTGAVGLLNWVMLRSFVQIYLVHTSIKKDAWSAIDSFSFVLFGILWLCLELFSQVYYRKGFKKKKFVHRFCLVTCIQVWLFTMCQIAPLFLGMMKWNETTILYSAVECIIGVGLIVIINRTRYSKKERDGLINRGM